MAQKNSNKTIVIKVGTSVLASEQSTLDTDVLKNIADGVDRVKKMGFGVIIVTSGAILVGMRIIGLDKRPEYLPEVQACAATGQAELMRSYDEQFKKLNHLTAQVLLTQDDINNRARYLNARNTLLALLKRGIVPIVNENDTVSTEEIKFGDNDRLSSLVASLIEADKLIIMSNVDGLYRFDRKDKTRKEVIRKIHNVTEDIEMMADDGRSRFGVGGMGTKLEAAKLVTNAGIECVIVNGKRKGVIADVIEGKCIGTLFLARQPKISARKRWIAYSSKTAGKVKVDSGAKDVLINKNRSLLASGVIECSGRFGVGDAVIIIGEDGKEFARGIANYSSSELNKIKGLKTKEIEKALGYKYYDEVIHRDNLVIL
ncbi:MAG: glutamate 5-kinase [Candidatus Omnitrophica bacterium]|nr:glutamate 5-kinase [Candidatus Omnitrophota bacterium]